MSDTMSNRAAETDQAATVPRARTYEGGPGAGLVTEKGTTRIEDVVVAKIAGVAAREMSGVYAMGGGAARALSSVRGIVGVDESVTQGVSVEVGERQAAVDLDLVVEYGMAIPDLAGAVRKNVINAVERMCGLEVTEVNIRVDDVHLPEQDRDRDRDRDSAKHRGQDTGSEPRVQ
ncbi:putative alkaline shock family protein YloU [Nonomuraea jabiensis]|uniref:Putative alkaline shock family protein YloU n=2 Tax=Nonomuraea jabiensis TaxID=882448 RepID=A0A7W9LGR5_9ACTN|nr:Asp23/Gls24 family envelope stress response protein [Nonomuraea jabiensis]MBB5783160.1 putative alkaline shock family protein YloU [Nonomuraea jabiensis]